MKASTKENSLTNEVIHPSRREEKHEWVDVDSETSMDFSRIPMAPLDLNSKPVADEDKPLPAMSGPLEQKPSLTNCHLREPRLTTNPDVVESGVREPLLESLVPTKVDMVSFIETENGTKPKPQFPLTPGLDTIRIEGWPFWFSRKKGSGPQRFVFRRADTLGHRVCVVLENGRRLYTSFADVHHFWSYYSRFQGKRCFYWLNRSFEVKDENSLLHFDVEWYTPVCDPKASEKLNTICDAINRALPSPVKILHENLSRTALDNSFKNSFHLYALVTLEHNAQNCMRDFVQKIIWSPLKRRQDMWCGKKRRSIVDLTNI